MTAEIRAPFLRWLSQFPATELPDREGTGDCVAIVADDRDDDVLLRVRHNVEAMLPDSWGHRFIRRSADNDVLASPAFWEAIPEPHILLYQRDTVMFRPVPEDLLGYDMAGAVCGQLPAWTLNGGFSLRRRQAMLDVLDLVQRRLGEPEDVYFTRGLRQLAGRLPDMETASRFSVESDVCYVGPPTGVHGTDKPYLSDLLASVLVDEALRAPAPSREVLTGWGDVAPRRESRALQGLA